MDKLKKERTAGKIKLVEMTTSVELAKLQKQELSEHERYGRENNGDFCIITANKALLSCEDKPTRMATVSTRLLGSKNYGKPAPEGLANAKHFVECWNACEELIDPPGQTIPKLRALLIEAFESLEIKGYETDGYDTAGTYFFRPETIRRLTDRLESALAMFKKE